MPNMRLRLDLAVSVAAVLTVAACDHTPTAPTPTVAAAVIQATAEGALVIHPSLDARFAAAMETPIRIRETGGGTATWNFARLSLMKNGVETERSELGASDIATAGFSHIAANGNDLRRMLFRLNSSDFTQATITLGFADAKDGRAFTADVPFLFSDVTISLTPLNVPASRFE